MRWYHVFLFIFGLALAAQTWIWKVDTLTDESVWEKRREYFKQDLRAGIFQQKHYSAHPGFAPLWLAAIFGLEKSAAIWVSLLAGGFAVAAYSAFPKSPLWFAAGGLTALQPLYIQSSLANAVAGPAAALGLFTVVLLEKYSKQWIVWLAGICFGTALVTHFWISALLAGPALAFTAFRHGWRRGGGAMLFMLATFAILNPLFLQHPIEHFRFNFYYLSLHTQVLGVARLGVRDLVFLSPFAGLGVICALAGAVWPAFPRIFERRTLFFLLGLTVAVTSALLYAQTQSVRYFFSLLLFWEVMCAMWLLELGRRSRAPKAVSAGMAGLLIGGQAVLLIQALL